MTIQSKDGIFNEINITPLTDIFLVLLIIMMVVAPMFQSLSKEIDIPEVNSGLSIEEGRVEIAVTKNAEFFIDGALVQSDNIALKLEEIAKENEAKFNEAQAKIDLPEDKKAQPKSFTKEAIVKADKDTKSSEIMKVMKAAQAAGYEKLIVAGKPLSTQVQEELEENKFPTDETFEE